MAEMNQFRQFFSKDYPLSISDVETQPSSRYNPGSILTFDQMVELTLAIKNKAASFRVRFRRAVKKFLYKSYFSNKLTINRQKLLLGLTMQSRYFAAVQPLLCYKIVNQIANLLQLNNIEIAYWSLLLNQRSMISSEKLVKIGLFKAVFAKKQVGNLNPLLIESLNKVKDGLVDQYLDWEKCMQIDTPYIKLINLNCELIELSQAKYNRVKHKNYNKLVDKLMIRVQKQKQLRSQTPTSSEQQMMNQTNLQNGENCAQNAAQPEPIQIQEYQRNDSFLILANLLNSRNREKVLEIPKKISSKSHSIHQQIEGLRSYKDADVFTRLPEINNELNEGFNCQLPKFEQVIEELKLEVNIISTPSIDRNNGN